ncbi:hypothetical protein E2C01_031135 [Portunus trituberculatus]|uniref:Transmembrane protein n=1 Tax=Portunus trituberculatus TaxID=210409 RepID=A0A5B7EXB7_PORTR|nr:hypothetical protein [Portunus trituberculatus]
MGFHSTNSLEKVVQVTCPYHHFPVASFSAFLSVKEPWCGKARAGRAYFNPIYPPLFLLIFPSACKLHFLPPSPPSHPPTSFRSRFLPTVSPASPLFQTLLLLFLVRPILSPRWFISSSLYLLLAARLVLFTRTSPPIVLSRSTFSLSILLLLLFLLALLFLLSSSSSFPSSASSSTSSS